MTWTGQTLSDVGCNISQLAYPLLVLALFGPVAGALADRWKRKGG